MKSRDDRQWDDMTDEEKQPYRDQAKRELMAENAQIDASRPGAQKMREVLSTVVLVKH